MKVRKVGLGGRILSQFYEILILLSIPLNFFFSFIDTIHALTFTNPPMVVAYNNEDNNLDHLDILQMFRMLFINCTPYTIEQGLSLKCEQLENLFPYYFK